MINYIKSILMYDFLFGIKHDDKVYISEKVFIALKDSRQNKYIIAKLAIFDYDDINRMKNELNLDDDKFEKLMIIIKSVIDSKINVQKNSFGEPNDYGFNVDGSKKYQY